MQMKQMKRKYGQKSADVLYGRSLIMWGAQILQHTVNSGLEMVQAKHVSRKNIFLSTNTSKLGKTEFLKLYIVLLRAELNCTIKASWMGQVAGVS